MPEPEFPDPFEHGQSFSEDDVATLVNYLADARASAAYWQGRCEGLEQAIAHLKQGHEQVLRQLATENELTIGYLKDRLNRLEARRDGKEVAP